MIKDQKRFMRPLLILLITLSLFLFVFLLGPEQTTAEFTLEAGERTETSGVLIDSGRPGPVVYVVAGIHGNEPAGRLAAESLTELKLKSGTLVLLPSANRLAVEAGERTVPSLGDLNRSFPGKEAGSDVQELAFAIYSHIGEMEADLVLDLHESKDFRTGEVYAVGKSLIYTHVDLLELSEALMEQLNNGAADSNPYVYFFDSKEGTINHEATNGLGIPALTFETDVEQPIENRVADHRTVILESLAYYEMLER